jgi:hypothetical protein
MILFRPVSEKDISLALNSQMTMRDSANNIAQDFLPEQYFSLPEPLFV